MINIAILGFGTVGSGVYEIVRQNGENLKKKINNDIDIKYILDIRDFSSHPESKLFVKDFDIIANDPEVDIVVEVIGGLSPAYDFTKAALAAGKHVVTSNKELVATHGTELFELAEKNGVNYMFEASVGGGIPLIRPLMQCLAANNITEIYGILNGTTNYILTQMIKKNKSFEDALSDAQAMGYAERNPAADIEGHDACRKICILASLAFGRHIDCDNIYTEGITKISLDDVKYADALGCVIKLIGYACTYGKDKVFARVSPMLVPVSSPLAGVDDVFNAILVNGNFVGEVMFYGRGAGKLPTASAVMADVIDIAKDVSVQKRMTWKKAETDIALDINDSESVMFVRIKADDIESAKKKVITAIPGAEFVCANLLDGEIAFLTPKQTEKSLNNALATLDGVVSVIRVKQD